MPVPRTSSSAAEQARDLRLARLQVPGSSCTDSHLLVTVAGPPLVRIQSRQHDRGRCRCWVWTDSCFHVSMLSGAGSMIMLLSPAPNNRSMWLMHVICRHQKRSVLYARTMVPNANSSAILGETRSLHASRMQRGQTPMYCLCKRCDATQGAPIRAPHKAWQGMTRHGETIRHCAAYYSGATDYSANIADPLRASKVKTTRIPATWQSRRHMPIWSIGNDHKHDHGWDRFSKWLHRRLCDSA